MSTQDVIPSDELQDARQEGLAHRGLKIAKVESFCLQGISGNWLACLVTRVTTEEGLVGWGEATASPVTPVLGWLKVFGQALVGESAWDIGKLRVMQRDGYTHGSATQAALSALDTAFWDLIAKRLQVPLYALLGGKVYDRVRIYHHPWYGEFSSYAEQTRDLVREGVTAGKLDPFRSRGFQRELMREEIQHAVNVIRAIREGGGDHFMICVEMHGRFNVATAVRVAEALKPFDPFFLEEPVPAENVEAMREVQHSTPLAVATGERIRSTGEYLPYLEQRACRILQPDIGHMGGVTALKQLGQMADDQYVTIAPHCCWGPVQALASAHVSCTLPNFLIQEDSRRGTDVYAQTLVGGYSYDPQYLDLPEAPGIGVHLPPEMLDEFAIDPEGYDVALMRQRRGGVRGY